MIPNMKGIRQWADGDPAEFIKGTTRALEREKTYLASTGHAEALPSTNFLAISARTARSGVPIAAIESPNSRNFRPVSG
jgi:hypothetical protein